MIGVGIVRTVPMIASFDDLILSTKVFAVDSRPEFFSGVSWVYIGDLMYRRRPEVGPSGSFNETEMRREGSVADLWNNGFRTTKLTPCAQVKKPHSFPLRDSGMARTPEWSYTLTSATHLRFLRKPQPPRVTSYVASSRLVNTCTLFELDGSWTRLSR